MNVFIGITQHPEKLKQAVDANAGSTESLMEVGPFLTKEAASDWKNYLSNKLGTITEIDPDPEKDAHSLWYGFTFEA